MLELLQTDSLPKLGSSYSVLISDIHLSEMQPSLEIMFTELLMSPVVRHAERLIILGDLFAIWAGDDELNNPWPSSIARKLYNLSALGVTVQLMIGNRDFLLGKKFCSASGAYLIDDPTSINLYGIPTVLLHGDSLCTEDYEYQSLRKIVRQPAWQREFLSQTLTARRAIGEKLKTDSSNRTKIMPSEYLDVSPQSVLKVLAETHAKRMIHGHTHKPAIHNHIFEGHIIQRWVLPDWRISSEETTGGVMVVNSHGCQILDLKMSHAEALSTSS